MNWTNIIIAVVALYGAFLSTYTLILQLKRDKPNIKVKVKIGFGFIPIFNKIDVMLILTASNISRISVTLNSQSVIIPNGEQIIALQSTAMLPYEILPGKNYTCWINSKELSKVLKLEGYSGEIKLIGSFGDQTDRKYNSKPYKYHIEKWMK